MCPLLAQLKIGFFSSFSAAAVYSTNEANKAGLKQSIFFRCLCLKPKKPKQDQLLSLILKITYNLLYDNNKIRLSIFTLKRTLSTL